MEMKLLGAIALFFVVALTPARTHLDTSKVHWPPYFKHTGPDFEPGYVLVKMLPKRIHEIVDPTTNAVNRATPTLETLPDATFVRQIASSNWTVWQVPIVYDPVQIAKRAKKEPGVANAEPLKKLSLLYTTPNDPDYNAVENSDAFILWFGESDPPTFNRLWHLDDIHAKDAWATWPNTWYNSTTHSKTGPLIAIVDTGCDMNHPDFMNSGASGTDINQGGQLVKSLCKQFKLGAPVVNGTTEDTNGHGTHVTGLALASGNNGSFTGHGVIGTGYNSRGMILRVIDDNGNGTDADAASAIFYAADNGADVISISLGTTHFSQLFQDAVTYAFQKGSLVVCAGNENGGGGGDIGPIYPAACSGALGVSASGIGEIPAILYSGSGPYVDIAAPGGDVLQDADGLVIQYIYSTSMRTPGALHNLPEDQFYPPYTLNYSYLVGTSMACPQVSGAAGLYYGKANLHQGDGYSNVTAYRAIEASAQDIMGAPYGGWEYYQGYGVLDMESLIGGTTTKGSEVGAVEGIVYYFGTATPNVAVKAKAITGGLTYTSTTLADGSYRFEALPPGIYTVSAQPFGALKSKLALVKLGSDQTGCDFWCGAYTDDNRPDDTPPVVPRFVVKNSAKTEVTGVQWGYDPECGIDSIKFQLGTTQGGSQTKAPTDIVPDGNRFKLSGGFALLPNHTYWLRGTYKNGVGLVTTKDVSFKTLARLPK